MSGYLALNKTQLNTTSIASRDRHHTLYTD